MIPAMGRHIRLEWVRGLPSGIASEAGYLSDVKEVMSQPRRQKISGPKRPGFTFVTAFQVSDRKLRATLMISDARLESVKRFVQIALTVSTGR